jgi:toxin FitB
MYLLDTNVISELSKPRPSLAVLNWFAATPAQRIYISSVTLCEIEFGLALMPKGKRRDALVSSTRDLARVDFQGRFVNLDAKCAVAYGQLAAEQQLAGRACSTEDAMIASMALSHGFILITRNTKDFAGITGLKMMNPWLDGQTIG